MKRILTILLALVLLCAFPAALAAGQYATAGELYEVWADADTYPDYITGVWSSDGGTTNLTFGVLEGEAGEAGMEEIRSLVENADTLTFVTQKYPRNDLQQIIEDLTPWFKSDLGMFSAGLNEYDNRVDIQIAQERQEDTETQAMVMALEKEYGDAVSIRFSDEQVYLEDIQPVGTTGLEYAAVITTGLEYAAVITTKQPLPYLAALICMAVVLCLCGLMALRPQHLLMGKSGTSTAKTRTVTAAGIEAAAKEAPALPQDADERIRKAIEELK